MSFTRMKSWLLLTAIALLGGTRAEAQHWTPFGPIDWQSDYNWFAPPDLSQYGNGPSANEGMFFQYDRLIWAVNGPKGTPIGSPAAERTVFLPTDPALPFNGDTIVYQNDVSNCFAETEFVWGNRYELGYVVDDQGWLFSIFHIHTQDKQYANRDVQVAFNDPLGVTFGWVDLNGDFYDDDLNGNNIYGRPLDGNGDGTIENVDIPPLFGFPTNGVFGPTDFNDRTFTPVYFSTINAQNRTTMAGSELMKIWRQAPGHNGGVFEWMLGVRYMNMTDRFNVSAVAPRAQIDVFRPHVIDELMLSSRINNHLVGPQFGVRWFNIRGRWRFTTEGRFMAAANFQQARVNGQYFSAAPTQFRSRAGAVAAVPVPGTLTNLYSTAFKDNTTEETFAPTGELRVDVSYQFTKSVAFRMGYTGMIAGGVGRASRRVDYTLPNLSVLDGNKAESLIVNGFNFGFEINR